MIIIILLIGDAIKDRPTFERVLISHGFTPIFLEANTLPEIADMILKRKPEITVLTTSKGTEVLFGDEDIQRRIEQRFDLSSAKPSNN